MREAQVPVSAVLVAVVGANPEEIEPAGESDGDGHKRYGSGRQGAGSEGQIGPKCRSHRHTNKKYLYYSTLLAKFHFNSFYFYGYSSRNCNCHICY